MTQPKRALITGITGQDGRYLAELLLEQGLRGLRHGPPLQHRDLRAASRTSGTGIDAAPGDLLDQASLIDVLRERRSRDEVYNLAAQSFVPTSWNQPVLTAEFTGARRDADARGDPRRSTPTSASTRRRRREMFGKVREVPQNETTPFYPRSPYGVAKVYGHWITVNYRESYDLYACSGILFNHESPRRGLEFVTRKITHARRRDQARARTTSCALGNLDAERDWGFAGDYVEAMWLMLQQDEPDDYVVATGETHTVQRVRRDRLRPRRPRLARPRARSTRSSSARPRSTC